MADSSSELQGPPVERRKRQAVSTPLIICATAIIIALLISVVVLALFSGSKDFTPIIISVMTGITTLLGMMFTLGRVNEVNNKQDSILLSVNGRLTQLLEANKVAAHARGVVEATAAIASVSPVVVVPPAEVIGVPSVSPSG